MVFFIIRFLTLIRQVMQLIILLMLLHCSLRLLCDQKLVSWLWTEHLRRETVWMCTLKRHSIMQVLNGELIVWDTKLKTLSLPSRLREVWSFKLRVKELRDQKFWILKEKWSVKSILLKVLKEKQFWKEKELHKKFCKKRILFVNLFKVLLMH